MPNLATISAPPVQVDDLGFELSLVELDEAALDECIDAIADLLLAVVSAGGAK